MTMSLCHCRSPNRQNSAAQNKASYGSTVNPAGAQLFGKKVSAAIPLLRGHSGRGEERTPLLVVPEKSWPENAALVCRQIGPAIALDIIPLLEMAAARNR